MLAGVPDGFGLDLGVAGLDRSAALIAWGDGVDDLSVGERGAVPGLLNSLCEVPVTD